jgi:hypothetical protein
LQARSAGGGHRPIHRETFTGIVLSEAEASDRGRRCGLSYRIGIGIGIGIGQAFPSAFLYFMLVMDF